VEGPGAETEAPRKATNVKMAVPSNKMEDGSGVVTGGEAALKILA
jgi:hypothetical protein